MNATKIIEILDPQAQTIRETVVDEKKELVTGNLFESRKDGRTMTLQEASSLSEFPVLLRDGIKAITFDSYSQQPTTYQEWCSVVPSDKPQEDWVEENALGELPSVGEGAQYPEFKQDLDRTLNIKNYKRGGIISVTEEMIRFNRTNLIKRQAENLGRAAANTREVAAMSVIATAANYTRTTAAGDNDIGNNTFGTAFSAASLNTALNTLRTMKDRKSGSYYGVVPNLLIVAPQLEMAAKTLLLSPVLQIPGDGVTTAKIYGTGTVNPFRGLVNSIIVSPRFGATYEWCLMESKRAVVFQEVEGLQILQESVGQVTSEQYIKYDSVRYRVRDWFGVGMLNDRFAFLSTATGAPAVG